MLISHKIIDALRGHDDGLQVLVAPGCDANLARVTLSAAIEGAAKFDFGTLALISRDGSGQTFKSPEVDDEELEWWAEGYISLPFKTAWYEWTIGSARHCAFLQETTEAWSLIYLQPDDLGRYLLTGLVATAKRERGTIVNGKIKYMVTGNVAFGTRFENEFKPRIGSAFALAIFLTLGIHSKSSLVNKEDAPAKLNRKRAEKGRAPLQAHTVVDVFPKIFFRSDGLGTHASPRLHKRRSHLRHYKHQVPRGKLVEDGPLKGSWAVVIPWCWVGIADRDCPLSQTWRVHVGD